MNLQTPSYCGAVDSRRRQLVEPCHHLAARSALVQGSIGFYHSIVSSWPGNSVDQQPEENLGICTTPDSSKQSPHMPGGYGCRHLSYVLLPLSPADYPVLKTYSTTKTKAKNKKTKKNKKKTYMSEQERRLRPLVRTT